MCNSNWATHCLDCSRRSTMKDNMGYSSYHHWRCLVINCLIFVMTCLWTFYGKLNIDTRLLVAWCVIPYWLKSLHLPSVASLLLCVTEWAGRWLYSSPLEALVVLVITGTDRSVISYITTSYTRSPNNDIRPMCIGPSAVLMLVGLHNRTCRPRPERDNWWGDWNVCVGQRPSLDCLIWCGIFLRHL